MTALAADLPHAVLLAAGASHRFGSAKLLAPLAGRPVIAHARQLLEDALADGTLGAVHAMIRPDDEALATALPTHWHVVVPDAPHGLSASVQAGVRRAIVCGAPAVIFCLADQPRTTIDTLRALALAWRDGAAIVRPSYADDEPGVPGHPLLIDRRWFALADETRGDRGLEPVLQRHALTPLLVLRPGRNPDLDTPEDILRL